MALRSTPLVSQAIVWFSLAAGGLICVINRMPERACVPLRCESSHRGVPLDCVYPPPFLPPLTLSLSLSLYFSFCLSQCFSLVLSLSLSLSLFLSVSHPSSLTCSGEATCFVQPSCREVSREPGADASCQLTPFHSFCYFFP